MQDRSDEQLMSAAMVGDQVALAALVTRYHPPLFGYLYRLVNGDRQLAEDLVQETLLRVLQERRYLSSCARVRKGAVMPAEYEIRARFDASSLVVYQA